MFLSVTTSAVQDAPALGVKVDVTNVVLLNSSFIIPAVPQPHSLDTFH